VGHGDGVDALDALRGSYFLGGSGVADEDVMWPIGTTQALVIGAGAAGSRCS
jgi:hypothetical protein